MERRCNSKSLFQVAEAAVSLINLTFLKGQQLFLELCLISYLGNQLAYYNYVKCAERLNTLPEVTNESETQLRRGPATLSPRLLQLHSDFVIASLLFD